MVLNVSDNYLFFMSSFDSSKAGARNLFQVSDVVAGAQAPGLSVAFSVHQQGAGLQVQQLRFNVVPVQDAGISGSSLTCYTAVPILVQLLF